jgi:hypothetical protein
MSYSVYDEKCSDRNGGGLSKYPWRDMKVNQAFTIPANELVGKCANYSPNVPPTLAKDGYKIATRKQSNGDMKVFKVA